MRVFNILLIRHKKSFLTQTAMAIIFMFGVLVGLDHVSQSAITWAVGASSMASSAFLIFAAPNKKVSEPYRVLGGYLLCLLIGLVFHHVLSFTESLFPGQTTHLSEIVIALSVGCSMLFMTALSVEHPPAAGLALALVVDAWGVGTVIVIVSSIIILAVIRVMMGTKCINLIS